MENLATENFEQSMAADTTARQAKEKYNFWKHWLYFTLVGGILVLGTVLSMGSQLVASFIVGIINGIFRLNLLENPNLVLIVSMLPMYAIAMPLFILAFHFLPKGEIKARKMNFFHYLTIFPFCMFLTIFLNMFGLIFTSIVGMIKGGQVQNALGNALDGVSLFWIFAFTVICAPIFEELVFRKMLVSRTVKYGEFIPVVFSGLVFGLFHGNVNQFVYAFGLGMLFAYIYVRTGKIIYSIGLHMVVNFIGSFLSSCAIKCNMDGFLEVSQSGDLQLMQDYITSHVFEVCVISGYLIVLYAMVGIGLLVALVAVVLLIIRLVKRKKPLFDKGEVTIPFGLNILTVCINPGFAIYAFIWMIMMVVQLLM